MEDHNQSAFLGMTPEKLAKLNHEYRRLNPHDLPEYRRRERTRFTRKIGVPERVYTTHWRA